MKNLETVIALWKEKGIEQANFIFACGGDCMGDTEWQLLDKDSHEVEDEDIKDYLDGRVYNDVEFYVDSDGHYNGESGTVNVQLNDEEDDFTFSKDTEYEYSESVTEETIYTLTEEEAKFLAENVNNINGGDGSVMTYFKHDFIMTDEQEAMLKDLEDKLWDFVRNFEPKDELDGEMGDWFSFSTQIDNNADTAELTLQGNELTISIDYNVTVFQKD
jgi:hypothetical protein